MFVWLFESVSDNRIMSYNNVRLVSLLTKHRFVCMDDWLRLLREIQYFPFFVKIQREKIREKVT